MKKIFFLLCLTFNIYAQNSSNSFLGFIKNSADLSDERITTYKNILDEIPNINLNLFYYFIESVNIDAEMKNNVAFIKFIHYMNSLKYPHHISFNKWINYQKDLISGSNLEEDIKLKALRNLDTVKQVEMPKESAICDFPVDSNKIDFFKYVYYSNQNDLQYDRGTDYKKLVNDLENSILDEFRCAQADFKNGSYPSCPEIPMFNKMLGNWELFSNKINSEDKINEYILDYYKFNYTLHEDLLNFDFSLNYMSNSSFTFNHSGSTGTPLVIKLKEKIHVNQIGIALGYRFQLKNQKSIFSSISLECGYASGKTKFQQKLKNVEKTIYSSENGIERRQSFAVYFRSSNFTVESIDQIYISLTTPLIFLYPNLSMSAGMNFYMNSSKHNLNYDYYVTTYSISVNPQTKEVIDQSVETEDGNYISPTRKYSFGLSPLVTFEYSVIQPLNIGINLGLYFQSFYFKTYF